MYATKKEEEKHGCCHFESFGRSGKLWVQKVQVTCIFIKFSCVFNLPIGRR